MSIRFRIRCTLAERQAIKAAAAAAGLTMADFVRRVVDGTIEDPITITAERHDRVARLVTFDMRLQPEDYRLWAAAAQRYDLALSTYIRLRLVGRPPAPVEAPAPKRRRRRAADDETITIG